MAPYAFSVTKSITWRNHEEFFANVYHFEMGLPSPTLAEFEAVLDALVVEDKKCHFGQVAFKSGRVWGPTDQGQAASQTRLIKDLSGVGTLAQVGGQIYKEASVMVQWYMGRIGAGGRKVWLRKFYHCGALPAAAGGNLGDTTIGSSNKAPFITAGDNIKNLSAGGTNHPLVAPDGTGLPIGTSTEVNDYLHIRQFKQ